jgi:hypothetical protein
MKAQTPACILLGLIKRVTPENESWHLSHNIYIFASTMSPRNDDEESVYSEESYYEDEEVTETEEVAPPPPSPARPAHPLFGGAGAKNALLEAANNMERKREQNPPEELRPSRSSAASSPIASSAPPKRPAHPLFGGGGAGGPGLSLNDQIKQMASKRNDRVAKEGVQMPEPSKPKKAINTVMTPGNRAGATQSGSLAEQVAAMAARRQNRMAEGAEPAVSEAPRGRPVPPPTRPATEPVAAPAVVKKAGFFGRSEPAKPSPVAPARTNTQPVNTSNNRHTFQKAQLRGVKPDPAPLASASSSSPAFVNAKLKPTGKSLDLAPTIAQPSTEKEPEPQGEVEESAMTKIIRRETPAVEAGPSEKITRVTKSDPTYEVVEYKCVCTVM